MTREDEVSPCWFSRMYEGSGSDRCIVFSCDEAQAAVVDNAPQMLALLRDVVRRNNFSLPADGLWNLQEIAAVANDILARIDKKEAPR